jgi:Flp pilus assembly pilin Flp
MREFSINYQPANWAIHNSWFVPKGLNGGEMTRFIKNFGYDEDGAVTVDWVVLTAAVVALALAAFAGIEGGVSELTANIVEYLNSIIIGATASDV